MVALPQADEELNQIGDYNDRMSKLYDWVANDSIAHKHVMGYSLKKAIGVVKGMCCLEAACGNGAYMQYLLDNGATSVVGVDLSSENLEVCRKSHKARGIPPSVMSYIQADLSKVQMFPGYPFDVVIMGCCICYSSNQHELEAWCTNAFQNLKPGGQLVCLNTRGALPADKQAELHEKFNICYLVEANGGSKSFSPAFVRFPNGWQTDYYFIKADTIQAAMTKVGFSKVERPPMSGNPEYDGKEDLKRLVELMPYDLFIATR